MLAVRGSGHGVGGECMRGGHNNPTNDGGFKLSVGISAAGAASTAAASGRQGQHVARAVGRGAPSMVRPKISEAYMYRSCVGGPLLVD